MSRGGGGGGGGGGLPAMSHAGSMALRAGPSWRALGLGGGFGFAGPDGGGLLSPALSNAGSMWGGAAGGGAGGRGGGLLPPVPLDGGVSAVCWGPHGYQLAVAEVGGSPGGGGGLAEVAFAHSLAHHHRVAHGGLGGSMADEEVHVLLVRGAAGKSWRRRGGCGGLGARPKFLTVPTPTRPTRRHRR